MARNYDELSHDRTFILGGETFVLEQDVHPDVLRGWDEEDEARSKAFDDAYAARQKAQEEGKPEEQWPPLPKEEDPLARLDKQILAFLNAGSNGSGDSDSAKRYKALRKRKENPLATWKIIAFQRDLVETQTRRPTEQPSPSGAGRGRTARSSGDA